MLDRRALLLSSAAAGAAALAGCAGTPDPVTPPVATGPSSPDAAGRLRALMDSWMQRNLRRSPELATGLGLDKGEWAQQKSKLSDVSLAQINRDEVEAERRLGELRAIPRAALSGKEAVWYDTLMYGQALSVEANRRFEIKAGGLVAPYGLTQLTGSYQSTPDFLDNQHTIETKADAEAYLSRLQEWVRFLDQETESNRHDIALGVIPPDFALDKAIGQLKSLRDNPADKSPLVQSIVRRTKEKNIAGDWGARASKIYTTGIQPALDRQLAVLTDMRRRAVHDAGVWRIRDGEAFYAMSVKSATTTDMTPDEIHRVGLDMVARLSAQADTLMRRIGLTQGSVGDRYRAMGEDPRYLYPNTDEAKEKLLRDLNGQVEVIRAKLPQYFGQLPKTPLQIKRVPTFIEAGAPLGYYNTGSLDGTRPGIYWINLRDTAETPTWSLPTLTYHEGLPGHHLQLTLQQESEVPLLMKTVGYGAYAEGWGLYSEELAVEMGMYENDIPGHIGMIHDAAFRAVRLVVDSGMHDKRWSREQAIKYMVDNIGDPEPAAVTEIERYAVWPGQATSYMVGKIKIMELREKAKQALGSRFDIRAFHDSVLLNGSMPLDVLENVVDAHIASRRTA
ncbi:MAG TPA: DUF885 family protein [Caulobacteraceae bacterium]|jgi:uncharacterized protein (DUF885 family)